MDELDGRIRNFLYRRFVESSVPGM